MTLNSVYTKIRTPSFLVELKIAYAALCYPYPDGYLPMS